MGPYRIVGAHLFRQDLLTFRKDLPKYLQILPELLGFRKGAQFPHLMSPVSHAYGWACKEPCHCFLFFVVLVGWFLC